MGELVSRVARLGVVACFSALLVACGSSGSSTGTQAAPTTAAPTTAAGSPGTTTAAASAAPRWETVTTLTGTGAFQSPLISIRPTAIQWRVRWTCDGGRLKVTTDPPPRRPGAMVDGACAQPGEGFSIVTGPVKVAVEATGPWRMVIDQQVTEPLAEPVSAAMTAGRVLGQGPFVNVEKEGRGTARLYQLADGSRVLRFEDFYVSENTELFVWLSEVAAPKTTVEVVKAGYRVLGNLKSTIGSENYDIPADIPTDRIRSVVIWCDPVKIAYAAASIAR